MRPGRWSQKEIAKKISRLLELRPMTLDELDERLGDEVSRRQILSELDRLVSRLIVCAKRDDDGVQVFEAWSSVIDRMKRSDPEPVRSARPRGRRADRIA